MKKTVVIFLLLMAHLYDGKAQDIRLNLYGSYLFDDRFDSYFDASSYYRGRLQGGFQWGGGLEYMAHPDYGVELLYLRMDTKAPTTYFSNGIKSANFDVGINYLMISGNRYIDTDNKKIEPYGGAMFGAGIINVVNPNNGNSATRTKFAWGTKLGTNIWAGKKVGIKIQAQLFSIVQAFGGSFYFGTGGSGAGLETYSSFLQFGLGGGLVYKLGK